MGFLGKGLAAGAVGTELLNISTYLDMVLRGRGASSVPEQDVEKLLERTGLSLGDDGEKVENRKSAVATLLGYATGLSIGVAYAVARPLLRRLPTVPAGVLVGLGAMAATDASSAALGTTDPRTWAAQDWLADLVPHVAFGLGVVATYDALECR
jgi:hypothetical protein